MGIYHDALVAKCLSEEGLKKILEEDEEVLDIDIEVPCGCGWIDIVIKTKKGENILVEAKTAQGKSIDKAVRQLKRYSSCFPAKRLVVAVNYEIPDEITKSIEWDIMNKAKNIQVVYINITRKKEPYD